MITVSSDFKNAMKADAKQMAAFLTDGTDPIYGTTDLQTLRIEQKGSLCKTVMRYAKAQFLGSHDYLDKIVSLGIGVVLPNTTTEYITYGNFLVKKQTKSEDTEETTVEMYDLMYESLKKYALTPTYPLTLIEFVQLICTELGWTFDEASFPNSTQTISSELFSDLDVSYRDILDMVAEASGCIIYFGVDNKLHFKQISGTVLETLTLSEQMTLDVESEYGELNSVVLSRSPQEDNIAQQDAESIATCGLNEFKIVNNVIVDSDRETWITAIFNALNGIKYFPTEVKTVGLGYFEVGDRIEVTDVDTTEKEMIISSIEMVVDGGFSEIIRAEIPTKSVTEYSWAGIIGKQIKNVQIIVNKQAGEIQLLNEAMETVLIVPQQSAPPESPETGDLYLDTDDNIIYRYNGTNWVATGLTLDDLEDYYTKDETIAQITIQADQITQSVASVQTTANNAMALAEENSDNINTVQSNIASMSLDIDSIDLSVQQIGGSNLLKNSTGLKETLEEWITVGDLVENIYDEFDTDLSLWDDSDNTGTIVNGVYTIEPGADDGSYLESEYIDFGDYKEAAVSWKTKYIQNDPGDNVDLGIYFSGSIEMAFTIYNGEIKAKISDYANSVYTTVATEVWSEANYKYLRIRLTDNLVIFETSDDNITWDVFGSFAKPNVNGGYIFIYFWAMELGGKLEVDNVGLWSTSNPRNIGWAINDSWVIENTESGSGIAMSGTYIEQTVPTIIGETYTFYCRYYRFGAANITISGVEEQPVLIEEDVWTVFSYEFVAVSTLTTLKIESETAESDYLLVADIVLKRGYCNGWVPAPNEVYGKNFKFDKDGFSVTSLTDPFKATLDNTKLGIYDTSSGTDRTVALFSKDSGLITKLIAQDEFIVQRYENGEKATRFIPTSTGCMITVND